MSGRIGSARISATAARRLLLELRVREIIETS
jgi:hypothetical protein